MAAHLEKIPSVTPPAINEDEDEEEEDEDADETKDQFEGQYDPKEFEALAEDNTELQQLFGYITAYAPQNIDLDFKLKPFIPDFIPTVGDIDAFIKVTRPDGKDDGLGLLVLDEPSAKNQSDASLLGLRLRALTKEVPLSDNSNVKVKTASNAKDIDNWIENIKKLHHETSGSTIQTQRLPDIDNLMQEWSPEFEELLATVQLPPPDLDCDLTEYVGIVCTLLDIPVHGSKVTSLHQLFSLYNEFRSSQHFKQLDL